MRYLAKFRAYGSSSCWGMAVFPFFKMAAVRHVGFWKFDILTVGKVQRANKHHHAKFRSGRWNRCRYMAVFRFSRWPPSAIFDFHTFGNFNFWYGLKGQCASPYQISNWSVKSLRRYGHFSIFQDDGRPPSWMCKSSKF